MWWALLVGGDLLWEATKGKLEGKLPVWAMDLIDVFLTTSTIGVGGAGIKASTKALPKLWKVLKNEKKAKNVARMFLGGLDLGGNVAFTSMELNELPAEISDIFSVKERTEFIRKKEELIEQLRQKELEKLYEIKKLEVQMRGLDKAVERIKEIKEKNISEGDEEEFYFFSEDYLNLLEEREEDR